MHFYTVFISFQEHYSAQNYMKTPAILKLLWLFSLCFLFIKQEIILKNMMVCRYCRVDCTFKILTKQLKTDTKYHNNFMEVSNVL